MLAPVLSCYAELTLRCTILCCTSLMHRAAAAAALHCTAVGVDNMFILAASLDKQAASVAHPLPHRVGKALAAVGPSITLAGAVVVVDRFASCSLVSTCMQLQLPPLMLCDILLPFVLYLWSAASCEVVAFALGSLTSMPALRNFSGWWVDSAVVVSAKTTSPHPPPFESIGQLLCAVCAALAVLLDFLLQVTAFVALLALDTQRRECGSSNSSSGGNSSGSGARSWGAM